MSEKRRIVAQADACDKPGELGALLRREGIYSSMLTTWRKQVRAQGGAYSEPRRGRKADPARPEKLKIQKLEREKARLERELTQARLIIDVQKKVASLLGIPLAGPSKDDE
jgi:transposase